MADVEMPSAVSDGSRSSDPTWGTLQLNCQSQPDTLAKSATSDSANRENTLSSNGNGGHSQDLENGGNGTNTTADAAKKPLTRRRTKTGCMTCRHRRIKCDETRPFCNNCAKSRKFCKGYGPQYGFKHTVGMSPNGFRAVGYGRPMFMSRNNGMSMMHHPLAIAPRPDLNFPIYAIHGGQMELTQMTPEQQHDFYYQMALQQQQQQFMMQNLEQFLFLAAQHPPQHPPPIPAHILEQHLASSGEIPQIHHLPSSLPPDQQLMDSPLEHMTQMTSNPVNLLDIPFSTYLPHEGFATDPVNPEFLAVTVAALGNPERQAMPHFPPHPAGPCGNSMAKHVTQEMPVLPNQTIIPLVSEVAAHRQAPAHSAMVVGEEVALPVPKRSEPQGEHVSGQFFYMQDLDSDDSDEDEELLTSNDESVAKHRALVEQQQQQQQRYPNHVLTLRSGYNAPQYSTQIRSFGFYANALNELCTYIPSPHSSPLNDPATANVFLHFIHVTSISMSLYERHPFDHAKFTAEFEAIAEARDKVPLGQNIWSHIFPVISFNNPALLQAILALASLQLANLRGIPPTAALKHYHISLRRIARNVRSTNRRALPATLAATLLLAYFEVWQSDHSKWCNHLFGASILFAELKLPELTRRIIPVKRRRWYEHFTKEMAAREAQSVNMDPFDPFGNVAGVQTELDPDMDEIDPEFLDEMTGIHVAPEDIGQGPINMVKGRNEPTSRDIENYEHQRDLFFWYLKMNIYQSILGGTKIFMEGEVFHQCPPRGPIGNIKAIYGTFDHLLLLLARVRYYANKDLPRKMKVSKMNKAAGPSPPPMFNGMLPRNVKVTLPMGFSPPPTTTTTTVGTTTTTTATATAASGLGSSPSSSTKSPTDPDLDLDKQTELAQREFDALVDAFSIFHQRLGPDFAPLSPEFTDLRDSPFGPTLQYRTYSVAGIWMNYYMGLIHLYRVHPSMPPASMIAAGKAAKQTEEFAQNVGRIAAGLSDDTSRVTEISTLLGAAFIESCFCLFVAGVQFRDQEQRSWLVRRMHDTARLTGWGSARQIAEGCEAAWAKAANMGHGPRFQKPDMDTNQNSVVWNNPRRLDRRFEELEDEMLVLVRSERTHYALGLLGVEEDMARMVLKDTMQ